MIPNALPTFQFRSRRNRRRDRRNWFAISRQRNRAARRQDRQDQSVSARPVPKIRRPRASRHHRGGRVRRRRAPAYLEHCLAMEEISRASAVGGLSTARTRNLCVNQIRRNGNEAQAQVSAEADFRRACRRAGDVGTGAGSDVVSMKTRAEKESGTTSSTATRCGSPTVRSPGNAGGLARLIERRTARHHRIPDREGMKVSRPRKTRQARDAPAPAYLRAGVRGLRGAGRENVLGSVGRSVNVLMSGLDYERTVRCGQAAFGIMQACLDVAVPVHERAVRPADRHLPTGQGKVADMYVTMNACRAYVYSVAKACDRSEETTRGRGRRDSLRRRKRRNARWTRSSCSAATATSTTIRPAVCCATPKLYEIGAGTSSEIRRMLIGRELFEKTT